MSVRFEVESCRRRLTTIQERVLTGCLSYGKAASMKMVKEAKRTRPWTDRTHLAKNALNGGAKWYGAKVRVELAHGVSYGIYLENLRFRHKGRLAVLYPTVSRMAPEIVEGWAAVVRKGGG